MKVRIIRNTQGPAAWYANRIGEVFDVYPYYHFGLNTGDWAGKDLDGTGKECLIAYEDGQEVRGDEPIDPAVERAAINRNRGFTKADAAAQKTAVPGCALCIQGLPHSIHQVYRVR